MIIPNDFQFPHPNILGIPIKSNDYQFPICLGFLGGMAQPPIRTFWEAWARNKRCSTSGMLQPGFTSWLFVAAMKKRPSYRWFLIMIDIYWWFTYFKLHIPVNITSGLLILPAGTENDCFFPHWQIRSLGVSWLGRFYEWIGHLLQNIK